MTTPLRIAGFLVALAALFGGALAVGNAVGPVGLHDEAPAPDSTPDIPGGLMISHEGYTFDLIDGTAQPGRAVRVSFTIEGPDGRPVTEFDVAHEKRLHLIAVRRDFTGFQHVHPVLDDHGTWSTELDLTPGQWRLFADFTPSGASGLTLGADLAVAGSYEPEPESAERRVAQVDDYTITLDGDLRAGADARLTLRVERNGRPVTDLQPYLDAYGHLVALREGDLAYLHVHPDGEPGDGTTAPGPEVVFHAAVPSGGDHHLFLDFKHQGTVRTASFVVGVGAAAAGAPRTEEPDHGH